MGLPGMARPMTAFPRSLLPSPAPGGMAPAFLAFGARKIDWPWRPGHEASFDQAGPLRHLPPGLERLKWLDELSEDYVQLLHRGIGGGLDQEFNSLDAQYDAASAYIKSQAHAGWTLIRSRYDDGGYSGGSTDRPDLQR